MMSRCSRRVMDRIANLTLRQGSGKGIWLGVDIAQGRLHLEGCDITSQSIACVGIRGGADPRLPRNRIHDGKMLAAMWTTTVRGTLEDKSILRFRRHPGSSTLPAAQAASVASTSVITPKARGGIGAPTVFDR